MLLILLQICWLLHCSAAKWVQMLRSWFEQSASIWPMCHWHSHARDLRGCCFLGERAARQHRSKVMNGANAWLHKAWLCKCLSLADVADAYPWLNSASWIQPLRNVCHSGARHQTQPQPAAPKLGNSLPCEVSVRLGKRGKRTNMTWPNLKPCD